MHRKETEMTEQEILMKQIEILQAKQETGTLSVDELIRVSSQIMNILQQVESYKMKEANAK